jgi:hypothetical protein
VARRYDDDYGYGDIGQDYAIIREDVDSIGISQPERPLDEISPDQLTADRNNYSLTDAILARFSTDAARTITGFAGAKSGIKIIANVGANNLVLANNSASSDAENRILCHSGADITLTANQFAIMVYDFTTVRWRAGKLA